MARKSQTYYSLCISSAKLRQLMNGKSLVVSHDETLRWKNFFEKKTKVVRFFDLQYFESGVFTIKSITKSTSLGKQVIRIEIEKRIL